MKLKKFTAVIASLAMAASFSACGNQTTDTNSVSARDTTAVSQASDADTEENAADVSGSSEDATESKETAASSEDVHTNEFDLENGTVIEAWYPLGGRGNTQILLNDETIVDIAAAHDKTAAQIILRWHLQAGHIALPGSNNPDHILENISIFDFELTDEEMDIMSNLDTGNRFFTLPGGTNQDELEQIIRDAEAEFIN